MTGATGFIGRSLLDHFGRLAAANIEFEVCAFSRDPERFIDDWPEYAAKSWLRWQKGDVTSLQRLDGSFSDVIHGAADSHAVGSALAWADQIITGTRRVLDAAVASGAKRFLLLSSGAVYGSQPLDMPMLTEDYVGAPDTTLPSGLYGQAKRIAEQLTTACYHDTGLEPVFARIFAITGRHLPFDGHYAIGNFIRDACDPDVAEIRVAGDGSATRTYLHTDDLTEWLLLALLHGNAATAYNIGSDEAISIADLANRIARLTTSDKPVVIGNVTSARPDSRNRYVPDVARMRAIGARRTHDLDDAIRLTIAAAAIRVSNRRVTAY